MTDHSHLFKDQRLTTSTRAKPCKANIPNVHDEVRLVANTGEEVLAAVTMVDPKAQLFDGFILGAKPKHIPMDLDGISFKNDTIYFR